MKHGNINTYVLVSISFVITALAFAGNPTGARNQAGLGRTATNDVAHPMLINNVFNYYQNNGSGSYNKFSASNEGFEVPKGKDLATAIFQDGLVWGCKKGGVLHVGGSTYRSGLQAGPIVTTGTNSTLPVADDPGKIENRLYRVRRDIPPLPGVTSPADPRAAAEKALLAGSEIPFIGRYEGTTAEDLLQQYWNDWLTWPAAQGAPYTDVDHNGTYDPTIDIPGVPVADQTMWYTANDLDPARVAFLAGSTPIGLEIQKTIWAYNLPGALGNTIFVSTRLINRSGVQLDSMYIAQWSDPDLGYGFDDFVGCDTLLNLGFAYNGVASDPNFASYGLVPPALGVDLVQGPIAHGVPADTAIFGLTYRPGFRNLPMSAFALFTQGSVPYTDPLLGPGGDVQWYNLLQGRIASSGGPFINPLTLTATKFALSGDPVGGTGWIDGNGLPPQDRRMVMAAGPIVMAPGDTQEVVVACFSSRGLDRLSSVTALKAD
ncbi:MAG TPA: hypothetical protein VML00_12395, partial [Bacteroidota bacterium]|nr:hypothetical protein [Bacteroidota bacterium]